MLLSSVIYFLIIEIVLSQNPIGLRASASLRGLLLGAAIRVQNLRENVDAGQYNATVLKNYQVVVPEGELKPKHIWINENVYNFTDSDWLIDWTEKNQMQLRGHNLVWATDSCIPKWIIDQEASITPDKAKSLLSDYIHTVVGRYRGRIPWWDVVNEAIEDSYNNTHPFNLRDCLWLRKLGPDFIKYAFMFAHEADSNLKLYYNDYNLEMTGKKANRTIELVNWLRSEGAAIHGIGLQWHIGVSKTIIPNDTHYQSAQHFIDNKLDIMVTELDVAIPTKGFDPIDPADLQKQGQVYLSMLEYVLYFSPYCRAFLTWGFTDRYSWIPYSSNFTRGDGLPLNRTYQPKPAYWQMQDKLARLIDNGIYRISPKSQSNQCLATFTNGTSNGVQLNQGTCNQSNEQWNVTWLDDGTYRLSTLDVSNRALEALNATARIGGLQMNNWTGDVNQEWVISSTETKLYYIGPRQAWWRVVTVYENSTVDILDRNHSVSQSWILTKI